MFTRTFWADALERALKTAAQAALASFGVGAGLFELDWVGALSITGAAVVTSLLTSIASAGVGVVPDASLVRANAGAYDPDQLPDPADITADYDDNPPGVLVDDEFDDGLPDHRADR